ncbi:MAG: PAS domain-containing sensor histidine kinase [bacterium]|nr:PAS domain-containing sensor histidine kinase [bacterium]
MSDSQLLNLLLHNMQDGVVLFDHDAMITRVNPAAEKLLGLSAAQLVGQPAAALPYPYNRRFAAWWNSERLTTTTEEYFEGFPWTRLTLIPYETGATMMVIQMSLRSLSEVMAIISSEIRAPLSRVQGYADLLRSEQFRPTVTDEQQMQFLGAIRSSAGTIQDLLESMRNLTAIYSERLTIHASVTSVEKVVEAAITQIGDTLTEKQQSLTLNFSEDVPAISGDSYRLSQVLVALLKNASMYSPSETTITLNAQRLDGFVQVAVRDQGIGLTQEDLQRVFRVFVRVYRSQVQEVFGLGAGLYIARHIIEAHGGKIWAEGAPDQGATFYFTVPIAEGQE